MPAIEVENLRKTYPKGVEAVRGVSFTVESGEIFGLLGPNGAGKSTTVRIIATLTAPTGGSVRVAGFDVQGNPYAVRRSIGYVGQKSAVDEEATGRENIVLQGRLYRMGGRELRDRAQELLEHFGLEHAAQRLARTYSGGMRRRLDIAMGLVHRPGVMILDEPTTGLDPEARAALWQDLERLKNEHGLSVLLTTHYLDEADHLSDRIAIVDQGQVVALDTPTRLKDAIHGDVVMLEFSSEREAQDVRGRLSVEGVDSMELAGASLHLQTQRGAEAIPQIVSAVAGTGIALRSVNLHRPTLDDVYFHFTGRRFEEAELAVGGAKK